MAVARETASLSELKKQFNCITTCNLCETTLTSPKILPCFHSFCLNCLNEYTRQNLQRGMASICPTCRTDISSQVKGVTALPTNEFINSIIATEKALNWSLHITGFQRYIPDKTFCKTHKKTMFDRYCNKCSQIMCQLCIRTRHLYHQVISIESAVKKMRQMIKSYAIGVESCQAYYRAKNNICETAHEERTAAATMNRVDCTPVRQDSRSRHRYASTQSPNRANRTPFMHHEISTLLDSWEECTNHFCEIIASRGLRDDTLNIVTELCKWRRMHEQWSPVQQSHDSSSARNHTSRRDIATIRELEGKEQRTQKPLPKKRDWTASGKRMGDIVKRQIEEKSYRPRPVEANLNEQRDWVADELQRAKAKSKLIEDKLHRKNAISPAHMVSHNKLAKEDLEAALMQQLQSNADIKNELAKQLQNEKRRSLDLEKLVYWIDRIDAQSAEFQMTADDGSDYDIVVKLQVSIVRKLSEFSEKERLLFNKNRILQHEVDELKSRSSSEQKTMQMKSWTKEKQFTDKIQLLESQSNHDKLMAADLKQLLDRYMTDNTDLLRDLKNLIKWAERGDRQPAEGESEHRPSTSEKIKASTIKASKELRVKDKQWMQTIEDSGQQIKKLRKIFFNEDKNHREIVNEFVEERDRLTEKIHQLEKGEEINELQIQIQDLQCALIEQKESNAKLREMLQQQVEPKKSYRDKLGQVSPAGANLNSEVITSKQQHVNNKHNMDDATAIGLHILVANKLPTKRKVAGIRNMGNTCYFGATIQSLVHTVLLTEELHVSLIEQHPFDIEMLLTNAYIEFLSKGYEINHEQTFRHMLKEFRTKSSRFADRGQHDSHDMFVNFLNCLRDEERRRHGSVNSPGFRNVLTAVDKVFGGHTITVYVCSTCKTPYHVCEPFLDISIPILGPVDGGEDGEEDLFNSHLHSSDTERQVIGYSNSARQAFAFTMTSLGDRSRLKKRSHVSKSEGQFSLEQCLVYYSRIERIYKEYLCSWCVAEERPLMTSALKRTLIYNPPAVLVLHLKRFEQTAVGFKKCNQHVTYDEYLDIGPYCSSNSLRITEPNDVNVWYSLYGVVVHKGSLTSGHYISYIKVRDCDTRQTKQFMQQFFLNRDQVLNCDDDITRRNASRLIQTHRKEWKQPEVKGQWYLADDEYIKAVGKTEALSQAAYLLFYERVAKSMDTVI